MKELTDSERNSRLTWDAKLQDTLYQLQDYQEAKDHPQAQVVNMDVEELYVTLLLWHRVILIQRT